MFFYIIFEEKWVLITYVIEIHFLLRTWKQTWSGKYRISCPPIPPVILWSLLCVWWVLGVGTGHPLLTGPVCCLIVVSLPPIIATPGSARTVSCLITQTPWSSPRSECLPLVVCLSVCVCVRSGLVCLIYFFKEAGWSTDYQLDLS